MSSVLHLYPSYQKTSLKNPTLFLKLLKSREDFCFQFGFLSSLPNHLKKSYRLRNFCENSWLEEKFCEGLNWFPQNNGNMASTKIGVHDFPDLNKNGVKNLRFQKDPGTCRLVWADFCWQNASLSKLGNLWKNNRPILGENGKVISDFF